MTLKSGFTLLETTIVIGIVSLLLTIGSNTFVFSKQVARDAVRKTDIEQIRAALDFYKEEDANRYYPAKLEALFDTDNPENGYIDKIPKDPINVDYCYSRDTGSASYILAAKLERGGPSSCNCGNPSYNYNYCFNPYGILLTPTPTIAQPTQGTTNTPIVPTSTPTPTAAQPTSTPTPTPIPAITCYQENIGYINQYTSLRSGNPYSLWSIDTAPVNVNCNRNAGTGENFNIRCQTAGTTTVHVSDTQTGASNTCKLTIVP